MFFFSSRRRHTRFDCDWSSDVCSSDLIHVSKPYKQVSREWKSENTVVRLGANGSVSVGGPEVVTIAGPCSVESERQIIEAARLVKEAGAGGPRGRASGARTPAFPMFGLGRPRAHTPPHGAQGN